MHLPHYELTTGASKSIFEFTSVGPKGKIPKIIIFSKKEAENIYNLAFGDYDIHSGHVNDRVVSNNLDSEKVLATVIQSLYIFFNKYPKSIVIARGSTKSRTRLYRMGISKFHEQVSDVFYIMGKETEVSNWEEFELNKEYISFAVQLKK